MTTLPSVAPLQVAGDATKEAVNGVGSVMVMLVEYTHPFASITLTECGPEARFGYDVFAEYGPLSTEYVYGAVPPVTLPIVREPLLLPLQFKLVCVSSTSFGPCA